MTRALPSDSPLLVEHHVGNVSSDPLSGNLRVIVFLADSKRPSTAPGGYQTAHRGQNLLPMFCHSVTRIYPHARFVILTTPETTVPDIPFHVQVLAWPIGNGPLLYERMRHYIAFLEQAEDDCAYLFLETDMLMFGRFRPPIADDWDVLLAYKQRGLLINSGMFLVRANRRAPALAFLKKALTYYESRHLDSPKWGADQAALRDAAGLTAPPNAPRVEHTETARVLLLPRFEFTRFVPKKWYERIILPPTWILHFSGPRKKAMPFVYWLHMGGGAALGRGLARLIAPADRVRRAFRSALGLPVINQD